MKPKQTMNKGFVKPKPKVSLGQSEALPQFGLAMF